MRSFLLRAKLIVCDAGPLIALGKIDRLQLLNQLYTEILVPDIVLQECLINEALPGAQSIKVAIEKGNILLKSSIINVSLESAFSILDAGEKAAILLAKELHAALLIDEKRGRAVASIHSLKIIGTAGLLLTGFREGFISDLQECLDSLQKSGYRLSDRLVEEILKRAQES
jgi:uncharacterized protein